MANSVFAKYEDRAYPYTFQGTLHVDAIAGGIPSDPKVAEGWIRTFLQAKEEIIQQAVAETMVERGVGLQEAATEVTNMKHLKGFKRAEEDTGRGEYVKTDDGNKMWAGELYIEGRQLKSAIKEAANVARSVGKLEDRWGATRKGITSFVAEHICVAEDRLYLGVNRPTGIAQRFVPTFRGTGIQYEEYCEHVDIDFTVKSDYEFTDEQWAMLWLTGEEQGIGSSRGQGFGRYTVTRWEPVTERPKRTRKK